MVAGRRDTSCGASFQASMIRTTPIVVLLAGCALAAPLRAALPALQLTSVFPPGARAGTTVEVTLAGEDLDDLFELRFSHPGVFARPAVDQAGKPQANRFVVAVAPNVPPGVYDVRAVGRFGISSPRAFAVGDVPESVEKPGNESPGGGTEVAVDSVVNGACAAGAVDYFRFAAKAGQRVLISCAAREIDSRMEPVVALSDAAGRELGRSRTSGVIDFTPPADGEFLLGVHDVTFRGGPGFFYRLSVSTKPHVDFVVPPAGQPGTKGRYVLYGRNLPGAKPVEGMAAVDGKPLEQLAVEIELPAAGQGRVSRAGALAAARGYHYRLSTDRGASNAVFIAFADSATLPEGVNDDPAAPVALAPPCHVAGQFFPQRDRDWFSLDAKKGDVWWVEVWSHRLGATADPFLLVQRVTKSDKGEAQSADVQEVYDADANAGGADFNTSSRDPAYRLDAKEDATYRLQVRDLFNTTRDDPRLGYVLSVRKEKPDFQLLVAPVRSSAKELPANPLLRKGGAMPVRVIALRRDGLNGEIALTVEGLPPGVSCAGAVIPAGTSAASLVLVAAEDAAGWAGTLKVAGKADVAGAAVVREAAGACVVVNAGEPPTEAVRSRLTADFAAAVSGSDVAPLSIAPAEDKTYEAPAGGKVAVPLKLTWRGAGTGKVKLKAGGHPLLDNAPETEIDANVAAAAVEIDLNRHKLPPGTYTLYVRAEGKVKYARNPEALKGAEAARQSAEKAVADATGEARKAAEQKVKEATDRVKELAPKDVEGVFYSAPVVVKVVAPK